MRSLATLGGIILLIVLAIAWKISNQVEAGQEPDSNTGVITLGVVNEDGSTSTQGSAGDQNSGALLGTPKTPAQPNGGDSGSSAAHQPGGNSGQPESQGDQPDTPPASPPAPAPEPNTPEPTTEDDPPSEPEIAGQTYVVAQGDTLYSILMRTYGKADDTLIAAIAEANQLDDPSALSIGMRLILPAVDGYRAPERP